MKTTSVCRRDMSVELLLRWCSGIVEHPHRLLGSWYSASWISVPPLMRKQPEALWLLRVYFDQQLVYDFSKIPVPFPLHDGLLFPDVDLTPYENRVPRTQVMLREEDTGMPGDNEFY